MNEVKNERIGPSTPTLRMSFLYGRISMQLLVRTYYYAKDLCSLSTVIPSQVMPRFVVIDDTNSNIQYSGPWFEVNDSQTTTGVLGAPFQNTLHGVDVSASFSFPFSGMSHLLY